jgi:hypothetical protein
MPPENRRTFVKKSVATSVSISFVGLIRAAHGEETPGTTTTTFDPQQTTSPTTGQTTTFDPQQTTSPPVTATTVTTTPAPSAAAQLSSHDHGNSERAFFDIGGTNFMLKITYHAYQMNNAWWNNVTYYTYFSAVLKTKMSHDTGDYTGSFPPTPNNGSGIAKSVTRTFDAHCHPEDGALSEISEVSGIYNAQHEERGWVCHEFSIGDIIHKLRVLLVKGETSKGQNAGSGMYMITRDKGTAILSRKALVSGEIVDQAVASVSMEKNYAVKHWYPDLPPGDPTPLNENDDYEEPDAEERGCHVKSVSKVNDL